MEINKILESVKIKETKTLFKVSNTIDQFYGKDNEGMFALGTAGRDVFTSHLVQNTNWYKINLNYSWNSFGLRGPEPDYTAKKKILFAGGSLCLGTGVPLESSFPYIVSSMLDASYINLSDVDTLSDLINPLKQFKNFNPDIIVINDTRFIQLYGWALIDIYKVKRVEHKDVYKNIFQECDINFLLLFETYLKTLFPNAKIVLAYCVRRAFNIEMPNFDYMKIVKLEKSDVIDIARDNAHPGIESHKRIAEKIYTAII